MKIKHPRWAWGGESNKKLESLLHSIPRQELEIKALRESEFGRVKNMSLFNSKMEWPKLLEPLEVEGYLYSSLKKLAVELKFKFRTMFTGAGQCSTGLDIVRSRVFVKCIWILEWLEYDRTMSDWRFLFVNDLERTWSCSTQLFSLHPSHSS
jgi:hypothetical protein